MTKIIKNTKTYTGQELDSVFFRPMLCGPDARKLGLKILYNMPVPTTLNFWKQNSQILKKFTKGWSGGNPAEKYQKTIRLSKVKAELGYSAADYFGMVYEKILSHSNGKFDNLDGTALEAAETELFKNAIAESIRATMWLGDVNRTSLFNTFDGFLKKITDDAGNGNEEVRFVAMTDMKNPDAADQLFKKLYAAASVELKQMKGDNELVFLVTGNVFENYVDTLTSGNLESIRTAKIDGPDAIAYRGIPVVDMQIDHYIGNTPDLAPSWAILTDRRNLSLAVNTSDYPASEITMWYNADEMENRQRAVFLAGCDYLLPELIVVAF